MLYFICKLNDSKQLKRGEKMKTYLCKEGNEQFTIEAENLKQAQEDAAIYNAKVIKEVK